MQKVLKSHKVCPTFWKYAGVVAGIFTVAKIWHFISSSFGFSTTFGEVTCAREAEALHISRADYAINKYYTRA